MRLRLDLSFKIIPTVIPPQIARIIDMQDKIGVIKEGKSADIIAVDGNPLKDIAALDKIKMVMKGGIFIKIEDIEFAV